MSNAPRVTLSSVSWSELFPWKILLQTIPLAASISVWVLATLGVVLTPIGWLLSEAVFVDESTQQQDAFFNELVELNRSPYRGIFDASERPQNYVELFGARLSGPRAVVSRMTESWQQLFQMRQGVRKVGYFVVGGVWTLVLWSWVGCAITRIALLRLTRDEPVGIDEAFDFAWHRWLTCLVAVLTPAAMIAVLSVPGALLGILMMSDWGLAIVGTFWIVVLALACLMVLIAVGWFFSWPLMIASISAENQNALDAVTRGFSYLYQRPVSFAFYVGLTVLLGGVTWLVVSQMAVGVVHFGYWSTAWTINSADNNRLEEFRTWIPATSNLQSAGDTLDTVRDSKDSADHQMTTAFWWGQRTTYFWNGLVSSIAVAFLYGHFWCMAAAVYLLMRFDVDDTEMDEIYLTHEGHVYELPPLKSNEQGIPQIQPLELPDESSIGNNDE